MCIRDRHYISKIDPNSDGTITWWNATRNINFVDGFCTVDVYKRQMHETTYTFTDLR